MKVFRRTKCTDRDLANFQDAVATVLVPISKNVLIDGVQLDQISITAAAGLTITLPHTLNRQPLGWFIVDLNAAAAVYRSDWNEKNITLVASSAATISIWIY